MFRRYTSVLDEALTALRAGEPIERIVARYPRHARKLRSALALAARVQASPRVAPRRQAQEQSWRLVRERAYQLRTSSKRVTAGGFGFGPLLKPAGALVALLLIISSFGGGLAYAAQDAMPDSPLYSVKLATEDVRLWFVFDDTREAEILLDQSDTRGQEIRSMVSQGKTIPSNVLSALENRHRRAADIVRDRPEETALRERVLIQAQEQEDMLVALWQQVSDGAREDYTEVVASLHNTRLGGGAGDALVAVQPEDLSGGIISVSGQAEVLSDGTWSIGGVVVNVDGRTLGQSDIVAGQTARVVVALGAGDRLQALNVIGGGIVTGSNTPAIVSGVVEEVTSEGISIGGTFFRFSETTVQTYKIRPGEIAEITVQSSEGGFVAGQIQPALSTRTPAGPRALTFEGTIEGDTDSTNGQWLIGGLHFSVTESTAVDASAGNVRDGARVQVEAVNINGRLQASRVLVLASEADADTVTLIGSFDGIEGDQWVVSGLPVTPLEDAGEPPTGTLISVEAERGSGGDLITSSVLEIESAAGEGLIRTRGTIKEIAGGSWTLEIGPVSVAASATVTGAEPGVGQRALIWSSRADDGRLEARYVRILDEESVLGSLIDNLLPTPRP